MLRIKIFTLFQVIVLISAFGQSVSIEPDKENYMFDEKIFMSIKADFKEDSITAPEFIGLKVIDGPSTSYSMKSNNGVSEHIKTWKYTLRAISSGEAKIISPSLYLNGKEIKCPDKAIVVLKANLSNEQLNEHMFKSFVEDKIKPKGTFRYVLNDQFGYIEKIDKKSWLFHRKLTEEEYQLIKKID